MAQKRLPPERTDDLLERQLRVWRQAVLGPVRRLQKGQFDYVCQVTGSLFLFLRDKRFGAAKRFFVLDVRDVSFEPFKVSCLGSLLVDFELEEQSLRYDERTQTYFYCSRRSQMENAGYYVVRAGDKSPEPRVIRTKERVSSLFVTADHVYLLDDGHEKLLRTPKSAVLALAEPAGGGKPAAPGKEEPDPSADELEYEEIHLGDRLAEQEVLVTAFSERHLIVGRGERYAFDFPSYPKLHALDLSSGRLEEHWLPSFACADFAVLLDWAEADRPAFETYLTMLSLYEINRADRNGDFLFYSAKGLLYTNGDFRFCDPGVLTADKIAAFGGLVDFRFRDLMSKDPAELDGGVLKALGGPFEISSEHEIRFIREKIGHDVLESSKWAKLSGTHIDRSFLQSLAKVLAVSGERRALAARWLSRNRPRQYVALALMTGKALDAGPAAILDDDTRGLAWPTPSPKPLAARPARSKLPVGAVRTLAERWIHAFRAVTAVAEEDRTDEQKLDLDDHRDLLEAVAATAISWETDAGYELVRWLDAQGLAFLRKKIASLIGEQKADPLRDLLGAHMAGEDADVANEAIMALWLYKTGAFEDDLLRWLRSSEDFAPSRAAYALAIQGFVTSLRPVLYSEVIAVAERAGEARRPDFVENEGIEQLLKKALNFRMGDPPREDALTPGDIAEMGSYAPYYLMNLIKRAFQGDEDLAKPSKDDRRGVEKEITGTLAFLERFLGSDPRWRAFDLPFLRRLAGRAGNTAALVEEVLKAFLESDVEDDVKYLLALHAVFTPGLLDLAKAGETHDRILIMLKIVFNRMLRERDHRRIFAVFALLELGLDPARERDALDFVRGDAWRDWPRLLRLGEHVLRYLPDAEKSILYEKLLAASKSEFTLSQYARRLAEISPRRALELYGQGLFKLGKLDEALFYGRTGDRRGYEFVLAHFTDYGNVEAIDFLGEYGGEEAIEALLKARDKYEAPRKNVDPAIRRIKKRIAKGRRA